MSNASFVGRQDVVPSLVRALKGEVQGAGKLTIQGIAGPGGIGKSKLLDHVLDNNDLEERCYLRLSFTGETANEGLHRQLRRAMELAPTPALKSKPVGFYFPNTNHVLAEMEKLKQEAMIEVDKAGDKLDSSVLGDFLDAAMSAGLALNDISKASKDLVNFQSLEKHMPALKKALPTLVALRNESPGILARLGIGNGSGLRNSLRENPARAVADALMADLSVITRGYRRSEWSKASQSKLPGVERLLLIVDDYEFVHESMGRFLVGELLPMLREAEFESLVIILGRDPLASTQVEFDSKDFDKHMLIPMLIDRLPREDLDTLLANNGLYSAEEQARAWRDTEGYPYYVQLWMEEAKAGSGSAEMARRFHRRTARWMSKKQESWLDATLFMEDVNKKSLRRMLDDAGEADAAFEWFQKEGSVRDSNSKTFRVREYLRVRLLDYLRSSDPAKYETLKKRAASAGEPLKNPEDGGPVS